MDSTSDSNQQEVVLLPLHILPTAYHVPQRRSKSWMERVAKSTKDSRCDKLSPSFYSSNGKYLFLLWKGLPNVPDWTKQCGGFVPSKLTQGFVGKSKSFLYALCILSLRTHWVGRRVRKGRKADLQEKLKGLSTQLAAFTSLLESKFLGSMYYLIYIINLL